MKKDNVESMTYSDFFDEYLTIEGALAFINEGLMNIGEKEGITREEVWNCSSALTVLLKQVRTVNLSLDIKCVMTR
jgi:hypothetical protein